MKRKRRWPFTLGVAGGLAAAWLWERRRQRLALVERAGEVAQRGIEGLQVPARSTMLAGEGVRL
ncbi:MAG: hypothetical protein EHM56_05535, partial [Chloroflexi bacterium]